MIVDVVVRSADAYETCSAAAGSLAGCYQPLAGEAGIGSVSFVSYAAAADAVARCWDAAAVLPPVRKAAA